MGQHGNQDVYVSVISILGFSAVALNIAHIIYVRQKYQKLKKPRIGTISISVSNIIAPVFDILSMLFLLIKKGKDRPLPGVTNDFMCRLSGFVVFAMSISMITHVAMFSFLSCISITHPFLYRRYVSRTETECGILGAIYLMSMFWPAMVIATGIGYANDLDDLRCSLNWKHEKMPIFLVLCLIFIVLIPAFVTIASTVYGCRKLQQQIQRFQRSSFEKMFYLAYSKALLIAWLVTWAPYTISVVMICCGYIPSPAMVTVSACFAKLSTSANAVIYYVTTKALRRVNAS